MSPSSRSDYYKYLARLNFEAALAALDRAIEIQAPRPAVLDGFLSQAQAALAALEAAATTLAPTGTL